MFAFRVMSGDPLADRVILWTKVTSLSQHPNQIVQVQWEISSSDVFYPSSTRKGVVESGELVDFPVKVDITGLLPDTFYWYRFSALGVTSKIGRTRTLPPPSSPISSYKIAVLSCSRYLNIYDKKNNK